MSSQTNILPPTYVPGFHNEEAVRKMRYNPLGNTGLLISHFGYGGACLAKPFFGDFSEEEAIATIREAIKSGVNYVDTAPFYGQGRSEEILGKALKGIPREAYYIATKIGAYELDPANMFDYSAEKAKSSLDKSLRLLGIPYVDIIQAHEIDYAPHEQLLNETLPAMGEFVKNGKAKFVGITAYKLSLLKETLEISTVKISTVLSYARDTLIDDSLREYIPYFASKGVGVIEAASPCMRLLTNVGPTAWHPASREVKEICSQAAAYCKNNGVELGRLAIDHALRQPGAATHLVGTPTREFLRSSLDLVRNGVSQKEKEVLAEVKAKYLSKVPTKHWEDTVDLTKNIGSTVG